MQLGAPRGFRKKNTSGREFFRVPPGSFREDKALGDEILPSNMEIVDYVINQYKDPYEPISI